MNLYWFSLTQQHKGKSGSVGVEVFHKNKTKFNNLN